MWFCLVTHIFHLLFFITINMKSRSSLFIIFSNILVFFPPLQNIGDQSTQGVIYEHLTMNHLPLMMQPHFLPYVHMHLGWLGSSKGFGLMWMRGTGRGGGLRGTICHLSPEWVHSNHRCEKGLSSFTHPWWPVGKSSRRYYKNSGTSTFPVVQI